eukprot:1677345-Lingulodinium_polyedra.AAC.1
MVADASNARFAIYAALRSRSLRPSALLSKSRAKPAQTRTPRPQCCVNGKSRTSCANHHMVANA